MTSARIYDRYHAFYRDYTERMRARLRTADPALPNDLAFLCASNWGNDAAKAVLRRYQHVSSAIVDRRNRECDRVSRLEDVAR